MSSESSQEELLARLLLEKYEPIAIVGMGLRFPGGNDTPEEFAAFLAAGRSAIGPVPADRWDVPAFAATSAGEKGKVHTTAGGFLPRVDEFDAQFFNISPKEARCLDPQQRLALETAWEALENANLDPARLRHGAGGVYFGASSNDYALELAALADTDLDGYLAAGLIHAAVSGRVSYFLGLRGPSITLDTACSSSLVALHLAVEGLRRRECDFALCGGVNAIHHPSSSVLLSDMQALAGDGRCKTFDESADGYARADGCGVLVLKRLSDAQRDGDTVLAVVRGAAVRQDGESAGLTAPNGVAQEALLRAALAAARLTPADIQYVEAHGTGTPLGDPIEMAALNAVFGGTRDAADPLLVGSVKTNLGHMEAAAGIGGVVKTVLQLRHGTVYPHLNMDTPSSRIPWDRYPVLVPDRVRPWTAPVRRAVVSSFGFAGTIASVVLEQAPAAAPPAAPEALRGNVFTLSAKTPQAFAGQVERYRRLRAERPDLDIRDVCHTANVGRAHFRHRLAGVVGSCVDLDALLAAAADGDVPAHGTRKVAFLFTGQGAQYPGMGAALHARYPVFAEALAECDAALAPHLGRSVTELVTAGPATDLDETRWTQPALFALEYALARLWRSWGIMPGAVAGHSIGEVVAATVAGLFSLDDAARIVAARGRLMGSVRTAGRMVSIAAEAAEIEPFLGGFGDLAIAAVNAPRQCVVSGGTASVTEVVGILAARGIDTRPLAVSHAFHSPLMAAVAEEFRAALAGVTFHETTATFVSTVTGAVAKWREIADVGYWVRQLLAPVDFQAAVRTLHRRGKHVFVEIGPAGTLTALARRCVPAADHVWLTSLRRADQDTDRTVLDALAKGYAAGLRVDWPGFHGGRQARPVTLPTYAFARTRYWLPVGRPTTVDERADEPAVPDRAQQAAAPVRAAFDPAALAAGDHTARRAAIAELVREELAAALSYPDPADLGLDSDFGELGVDSLVAVEVRKALSAALPVECPPAAVFEHPTARRLAHFLSDLTGDRIGEHTGELEKIG